MSGRYTVPRTKGLYDPESNKPFAISRTKINLFERCARCFYLDRRLGIAWPPGYPFTLNNAVDGLLKKEFDLHRVVGTQHPVQAKYRVDARPASHALLEHWRNNFKGVRHLHPGTNLEVYGAIDDLWVDLVGLYSVVDYKATARQKPIESLDDFSHGEDYMRQLDVYQWLLVQNGLPMSEAAYWLYVTGCPGEELFNDELRFEMRIIPYRPHTSWVEPTLRRIKFTLDQPAPPVMSDDCDYCRYTAALQAPNE